MPVEMMMFPDAKAVVAEHWFATAHARASGDVLEDAEFLGRCVRALREGSLAQPVITTARGRAALALYADAFGARNAGAAEMRVVCTASPRGDCVELAVTVGDVLEEE